MSYSTGIISRVSQVAISKQAAALADPPTQTAFPLNKVPNGYNQDF